MPISAILASPADHHDQLSQKLRPVGPCRADENQIIQQLADISDDRSVLERRIGGERQVVTAGVPVSADALPIRSKHEIEIRRRRREKEKVTKQKLIVSQV